MMQQFDTVVVSDLHLGAHNARADDFLRFLDSIRTRRLILNGDIFDSDHLRRLTPDHLEALEAIRSFSKTTEVVWLQGNHDPAPAWSSAIFGLQFQDEIVIDVDDKQYLVCHGHEWDASMQWPAWLIHGADTVYGFSQWIDPTHRLARSLKRRCKRFCKAVNNLQHSAMNEARKRNLAGVILGHTHIGQDVVVDGIHYLNCGCWTEKPSSFVGIRDGVARRMFWESIRRRRAVVQLRSRSVEPSFSLVDLHPPEPLVVGD